MGVIIGHNNHPRRPTRGREFPSLSRPPLCVGDGVCSRRDKSSERKRLSITSVQREMWPKTRQPDAVTILFSRFNNNGRSSQDVLTKGPDNFSV